MFKTILVPTDGSPLSDTAVKAAVHFAALNNAKVIGLAVAEPYPYTWIAQPGMLPERAEYERQVRDEAFAHVDRIASEAEKAGVPAEVFTASNTSPAEEIVKAAADHRCDLIFLASHGRRGLDRLLLGSETQKVLLKSKIPVLVYRAPMAEGTPP